ncbi:hypothetical protein BFS06_13955 [Clostridium perfringens]|uniref:Uncharacterized protein n=1 Tax=Clostridium perfringens TaxID=1502 RepID=A0A140GRM6_CLOPF|nr:hypothetical protein [Clostridium perfringens]AMN31185.1 hypothetical protein JFP838_pA0269 [Clostridium perfringens]TBX14310.1 hypothetical protein BFS06_13955 [Clostridium perfringens]
MLYILKPFLLILICIGSTLVALISYQYYLNYKAKKIICKYKYIYPNLKGELLYYLNKNAVNLNINSMNSSIDCLLTKKSVEDLLDNYDEVFSELILTEYDMFIYDVLGYNPKTYKNQGFSYIDYILMDINIKEAIKKERFKILVKALDVNNINHEKNRKMYRDLIIVFEQSKLEDEDYISKLKECIIFLFKSLQEHEIDLQNALKYNIDDINIKIKFHKELIEKGLY